MSSVSGGMSLPGLLFGCWESSSQMKKDYDFRKGKRGAVVPIPPGKTRITIRLDDDILNWFRAQVHAMGGGSYQTLINTALREYMQQQKEPLEEILRRVIREELQTYG